MHIMVTVLLVSRSLLLLLLFFLALSPLRQTPNVIDTQHFMRAVL